MDLGCPQLLPGHLYLHLPLKCIQIGFQCGLSVDNPFGLGTIGTTEGVTGHAGVRGSTEVEVSAEVDGHAGVVGSAGLEGHAEPEGVSADGAPVKRKRGLAEANDFNTGPKDLMEVLVTT